MSAHHIHRLIFLCKTFTRFKKLVIILLIPTASTLLLVINWWGIHRLLFIFLNLPFLFDQLNLFSKFDWLKCYYLSLVKACCGRCDKYLERNFTFRPTGYQMIETVTKHMMQQIALGGLSVPAHYFHRVGF